MRQREAWRGRIAFGAFALAVTVVVACSGPSDSTSGDGCPAPAAGNESCGSCGGTCYSCANGTCPADPCATRACDGTAHCSTKNPNTAHADWAYCGSCATSLQCSYCPRGTCSADPCKTTCDGSGGNGPVGGGSGGTGSGGGSGGTTSNSCPAGSQLECSQWTTCANCNIQSCTCYDNNGNAPYCGMYFHASDGAMFWCGSDSSCSTFDCTQQAKNAAAHCCP